MIRISLYSLKGTIVSVSSPHFCKCYILDTVQSWILIPIKKKIALRRNLQIPRWRIRLLLLWSKSSLFFSSPCVVSFSEILFVYELIPSIAQSLKPQSPPSIYLPFFFSCLPPSFIYLFFHFSLSFQGINEEPSCGAKWGISWGGLALFWSPWSKDMNEGL